MQKNDLLLFSTTSPILYGIYIQGKLFEAYETQKKTLDALSVLHEIIEKNNIGRIFYANGPGSFTAIKLTHIFLQTVHILKGVELFCVDSFFFNQNAPIRAFGNQYFQKKGNEIILASFESESKCEFVLPEVLEKKFFDSKCEPLYVLPAV